MPRASRLALAILAPLALVVGCAERTKTDEAPAPSSAPADSSVATTPDPNTPSPPPRRMQRAIDPVARGIVPRVPASVIGAPRQTAAPDAAAK